MYFEKFPAIMKNSRVYRVIIWYLATIAISCIIAGLLGDFLLKPQIALVYTLFIIVCIFIALLLILTIWFAHNLSSTSDKILAFGFIYVVIFSLLHLFYYSALSSYPYGNYELAEKYWILVRLAEAVVLFLSCKFLVVRRISKIQALVVTLAISVGISLIILYYPGIIPNYLIKQYISIPRIILEILIFALFVARLIPWRKKTNKRSKLVNKYIYKGVSLIIPANLCLIIISTEPSFYITFGYILKVVSYYYLFRAVFTSTVIYPYDAVKKARCSLKNSRKDFKDILNGLSLALITFDHDFRVSFANKKACVLLECSKEDIWGISGEQLGEMFFPDDKKVIDKLFINSDGPQNIVRECRTLRGNDVVININTFSYKNGILISFSDTKKEQELIDLKVQTRTILNSINNLVVLTDINFKIIMFNKAFKVCLEMRDSDIIGKDINHLNEDIRMRVNGEPYIFHRKTDRNDALMEASLITPRGNKKILLVQNNPVFNVKDEIIGYIWVSSDITKFKQEQERMMQQEKLAAIGQMGSGIVHETKNHLASIKGYCQLLTSKTTDEQLRRYVGRIENIADDVNNVIIEFLSLSKPTETIMDIVSLNETIESIRYMLESPSFVKGVGIDIDLEEDDRDIKADESKIKQIILNMAKNSIEAMAETQNPLLKIHTRFDCKENKMKLIVSDNGEGISKENLHRLGNSFFTTKEMGTGLGLNLCYRIVEEHGGQIQVKSEKGKGTTFTMSFPCYDNGEQ